MGQFEFRMQSGPQAGALWLAAIDAPGARPWSWDASCS